MTPQVINAGKIRLHHPTSQQADDHFENLRREFAEALQRLRALVDDAIDTSDFIRASGMVYAQLSTCQKSGLLLFRGSHAPLHRRMREGHSR